ncbi:MAG: ABC transporter substrate-binding protein [Spirochaetia bacterium]|nr:ABC transporter substrate-binding protein [Spirochaetia bacterium]
MVHLFQRLLMPAILVLISLGITAGILVSCSPRPILIGAPLGLTGLASNISVHGRNGMELAVAEINADGGIRGRPLQLLIENDHDNPDAGLQAATKLVEQGTVALVGHMASASAIKSAGYLTEKQIPVISPTISSTDYSGKDDYFFRIIGPNDAQGRTLAQEALKRGYRTASVVLNMMNNSYTQAVYEGFHKSFEDGGGIVRLPQQIADSKTQNFDALADALLGEGPDLILCAASSFELASIRQALARKGRQIPVFGSMWARTPDLMVFGGKTVEGVVLVSGTDMSSDSPALARFMETYKSRYGEEPEFGALYGYEAMHILTAALRKAGKTSGQAIKTALLSIGSYSGLYDEIMFDQYGDTGRPYYLYEVRNGSFVRLP